MVYADTDHLVRTDHLLVKNLKTNKVLQIAREIGRQPVLSFGNSSGDCAMHNYVICDNAYRSEAFMLIADDEVRDYGNAEKAAELREKWEQSGYNVISMANDWKTIYGDGVKKTELPGVEEEHRSGVRFFVLARYLIEFMVALGFDQIAQKSKYHLTVEQGTGFAVIEINA